MGVLLQALWTEYIMERQVQAVDEILLKQRPDQEPHWIKDSPLQHRLLHCKLQRAKLEVDLYTHAIERGAEFHAAHAEKHPGPGGMPFILV